MLEPKEDVDATGDILRTEFAYKNPDTQLPDHILDPILALMQISGRLTKTKTAASAEVHSMVIPKLPAAEQNAYLAKHNASRTLIQNDTHALHDRLAIRGGVGWQLAAYCLTVTCMQISC